MNEIQKRRQRWFKALESGEYTQGVDFLRTHDKFCALGVACDLYAKQPEAEIVWDDPDEDGVRSMRNVDTCLPDVVRRYYGLNEPDPMVTGVAKRSNSYYDENAKYHAVQAGDIVRRPVSWWNDSDDKTLPEIAAMLRAELALENKDKEDESCK